VTFPDFTELASSVTWGGTAVQNILTHTFDSSGANTEFAITFGAGGSGSASLVFYVYLNGTLVKQQSYTYGGVMIGAITPNVGSNSLLIKAKTLSGSTVTVPLCYVRTLELKK
jgi:hypothetical protein